MLTADWTVEHIKSRKARVLVDSGTQAGIHVPLGVFCNITGEQVNVLGISVKACGELARTSSSVTGIMRTASNNKWCIHIEGHRSAFEIRLK
jgi:hypothetical protein